MQSMRDRLIYCSANVAAVLAALYTAFWLDLDRPYWAVFTVFVVSKPISGAVRAKSVFRLVGTLLGASMSVFLVPPLVQSPVLLSLAVSAWIGICLFAALQDRTPGSYTFLLAGYTVPIVSLATVNNPTSIFNIAVSRLEEISIGILCTAAAHSLILPHSLGNVLRAKAEETIGRFAEVVARTIAPNAGPPALPEIATLATSITDLQTVYSQIGYDTSDVPRAPGIMVALLDRLAIILPAISLVHRSVEALNSRGAMTERLRAALDDVSMRLSAAAGRDSLDIRPVDARLDALSEALDKTLPTDSVALERLVVYRSREIATALAESKRLAAALSDRRALADVSSLIPDDCSRPLYRDQFLAVLSAAAAAAAVLFTFALWIEGSWPEGFVATQFAAICCLIFGGLDSPSKIMGEVVVVIAVGVLLAVPYEFAILPAADDFVSLALVLTPVLLLFSFLQTVPRTEMVVPLIAAAFAGALALQETFVSDLPSFVNASLAEMIGPLIAAATMLVFRTIDPVWNAHRILRSGRMVVADLAGSRSGDPKASIMQLLDRAAQAATRLNQSSTTAGVDVLRDLRVGLQLAAFGTSEVGAGRELSMTAVEATSLVSSMYTNERIVSAPPEELATRLVGLSNALSLAPPSRERQAWMVALTGLRLDFDPAFLQSGAAS